MRIHEVSLSRFRSIIEAEKVLLGDYTVLIGRNNEGKSNILRGINIAIESIRMHSRGTSSFGNRLRPSVTRSEFRTSSYKWQQDFPIQLQNREKGKRKSRFRIDFELTDQEVIEFHTEFGSTLNGFLPIEIEIGSTDSPEMSVLKQGKSGKSFRQNLPKIAAFITSRFEMNYIPAVRTERDAMNIIEHQVRLALKKIELDEDYKDAIRKISEIQRPLLDGIASDICTTLKSFIPAVNSVKIDTSEARIYGSLSRDISFLIDDGAETALEYKGDGIKSLVALSLSRSRAKADRSQLYAIEEPESHLHPGAVHELREVITGLSDNQQVIVSTHNPIFVDRNRLSTAVIVQGGRAARANTVERIRDALGIRVSDNLINAEMIVICEGESENRAIPKILSSLNRRIKSKIDRGDIIFRGIGGSGNLSHRLSTIRNDMFSFHVILDFDQAGKLAIEKAQDEDNLNVRDYSLLRVRGNYEAELEDCVKKTAMRDIVSEEFGVNLDAAEFGGNAKWSKRMEAGFEAAGKQWTTKSSLDLKKRYADIISQDPEKHLTENAKSLFLAVAQEIEKKLSD